MKCDVKNYVSNREDKNGYCYCIYNSMPIFTGGFNDGGLPVFTCEYYLKTRNFGSAYKEKNNGIATVLR